MRKLGISSVVVSLLLLVPLFAGPVAAQEEDGNIAFIVLIKAKPGMQQEFEEGAKKHTAWHRQQNDPETWVAWQVISGENTGTYGVGTFGHRWEDFDTPTVSPEADLADRRVNIQPYVESAVVRYYRRLANVSRPSEEDEPMALVLVFHLNFGKDAQFNYTIRKFHEAIGKTNWPVHYNWYQLLNGGQHPTYVVVLPRANWAAFKPQEKSFVEMLEEAYGRQEAESLIKTFEKSVRSEHSQIIRDRPDLSYIPAAE